MNVNRVRAILAIIIVAAFSITATVVLLTPSMLGRDTAPFIALMKDIGGLYSGLLGVIIGFYFGKHA